MQTTIEAHVSNFVVGVTYMTKEGNKVRILREANQNTEYWSVLGDDAKNGWRYADNGWVTGTRDECNPRNLIIGSNQND